MIISKVVHPSTLLASAILSGAFASPAATKQNLCASDSYTLVPDNGTGTWPYRKYRTTNITSPVFDITQTGPNVNPDPIFMTINALPLPPGHGAYENAAYMMTNQGDLVWSSGNLSSTSNFRTQTLYNEPVISYWRGTGDAGIAGFGYGEVRILNTKLEIIHTICPDIDITILPGTTTTCVADIHESYITPQNTILVTAYNITTTDLTAYGGPANGYVYNPLAVEVDIETNKVLWSWSPLDHVPISDSQIPLGGNGQNASNAYDWFHMNSIQPIGEDNFLINSRNAFATYLVHRNGTIMWTINGIDGGDFGSLPDGIHYSGQHNARLHPSPYDPDSSSHALLTYFANNNIQPSSNGNDSVGLGLLLDLPPSPSKPPKLYSALVDPEDQVASYAEGSHQLLGNPNPNTTVLLGYGIVPTFKEFLPNGTVHFSVNFGYRDPTHSSESYRVFKEDWHATPSAPLDLVVEAAAAQDASSACAQGAKNRGYVSWNGATDVDQYALLAGSGNSTMARVGTFARKGFETEFVIPEGVNYVQVEALEDGETVGRSGLVMVVASGY